MTESMNMTLPFFARHLVLIIPVLLAACETVPVPRPQLAPLPPRSVMSAANTRLREELPVVRIPLAGGLSYHSVTHCQFNESLSLATGGTAKRSSIITVKPIRNRLLITVTSGAVSSTILIDQQGKLFDYNIVDMVTGKRTTPESFAIYARTSLAEVRAKYGPNVSGAHIIKGESWLPMFVKTSADVDDTIANLLAEDDSVWGAYVYRGTTWYHGTAAAVIDITRKLDSRPRDAPVVIGFDIINLKTMLPMLHVLDAGSTFRLEQMVCI